MDAFTQQLGFANQLSGRCRRPYFGLASQLRRAVVGVDETIEMPAEPKADK